MVEIRVADPDPHGPASFGSSSQIPEIWIRTWIEVTIQDLCGALEGL
jgi:hypothetical protein